MFWSHNIVDVQKETRGNAWLRYAADTMWRYYRLMTDDRNLTRTKSRNPLLVILMGVFCEMMARRNGA
jgi:hypothetical protein